MTDLTPEQIAEIRARCEAATEGPWREFISDYDAGTLFVTQIRNGLMNEQLDPVADEIWSEADAAFIAHARTDIPALLAALDELVAEIARLRDVADAATQMRSACPMDWMHGECDGSQCAPVCCALAALDEEVGE